MKLVVGLGNPGEGYKDNRHNVGHMVVDFLIERQGENEKIGMKAFKTEVFMNESGREVRRLKDYYKVSNDELYVVYDDLDIPLGNYKISFGKSPRVHNGVNSVIDELGKDDFWHVRVGIDNRQTGKQGNRETGKEYVLGDFLPEEMEVVRRVVEEVSKDFL